ncbi:MAG: TIGR02678 family protein [Streptosporangiaceae bacterium]|nr:TIGR02678 family protein [Streptosporangiaceae bacterium]
MRVAADVSPLELDEYQQAARLMLRHPLVTTSYPDKTSLPLVRKWAGQLRADFAEVLGYTLVSNGETARLRRVQDTLDATRPALTRARRPFDRRRYAYLVLALSALGRSGKQIALGELAEAVAAEAGRIDGLGMDTGRKADRDAFVDAVAWLEARGALHMADGSAAEWVNDPEHAEALYDIDREVVAAIYAPSRVLQHVSSVTELLDGTRGVGQGINAQRRLTARRARRLVLENPVVYYADLDPGLHGQLRSPALAEDLERLTGLTVERRAEGVALVNIGQRLTDITFPGTGTVAQAGLLLCARIAGYLHRNRARVEHLPAATAAERLAEAAQRIDSALPDRGWVARLLAIDNDYMVTTAPGDTTARSGAGGGSGGLVFTPREEQAAPADVTYPFLSETWLRTELRKLVDEFGSGMAEKQVADLGGLLSEALSLLAGVGLVARVDGGVLVLPLLARYRGVTAQIKEPSKP